VSIAQCIENMTKVKKLNISMHVVKKITVSPMPLLNPFSHLATTMVCDRQIHNINSYIRNMQSAPHAAQAVTKNNGDVRNMFSMRFSMVVDKRAGSKNYLFSARPHSR